MRVLHVIDRLSYGGAERSLRDELAILQGEELQHDVVLLHPERTEISELRELGVRIFEPGNTVASRRYHITRIARTIQAIRPNLVHTTLFEADLVGRLAARLVGTPAVTSLVNTPYAPDVMARALVDRKKLIVVRALDRLLSRHATAAFRAITNAVAEASVRDLRVPRDRVQVIPRTRVLERLGVPGAERRRRTRSGLGIDLARPLLLNVARHEAQKGLEMLLDAVAILRQRHPGLMLLQAGRSGNRTKALQQQAERLQLQDTVRFVGFREDVGDLLAASDVFVFPSLYEGLGGAVLEAMAMKVPVVASDVPALAEVLGGGQCGLLVHPGDPQALAHGVERVLCYPEDAERRAAAGADRYRTVYSQESVTAQLRAFYLNAAKIERGVRTHDDPHCASAE